MNHINIGGYSLKKTFLALSMGSLVNRSRPFFFLCKERERYHLSSSLFPDNSVTSDLKIKLKTEMRLMGFLGFFLPVLKTPQFPVKRISCIHRILEP